MQKLARLILKVLQPNADQLARLDTDTGKVVW